ncbi:11932_t:CDS:2, partial [Entrophospora sp. SA101]
SPVTPAVTTQFHQQPYLSDKNCFVDRCTNVTTKNYFKLMIIPSDEVG